MMNASDARAISMSYYKEAADHHLDMIEKYIKVVAESGGMSCAYANDIKGVAPEVKAIIFSVLSEAGYRVGWDTTRTYLSISWEEKTNG